MKKEVVDFVVEKTHELMKAHSCCKEAKVAAQTWLDAVGAGKEADAAKAYLRELEEDIMPIDGLIGFAESEAAVKYLGAETAKGLLAHAKEIKAAGAKFCDCPACAAALAIVQKKKEMLA